MLISACLARGGAFLAGAVSLTAARDAFALNRRLVRIGPPTPAPAATAAVAVPATRNLRRSIRPVPPAPSPVQPVAGENAVGADQLTREMIPRRPAAPPPRTG